MIEHIKSYLCQHLDDKLQSDDLSFIQLSNTKLPSAKIVFLIFKRKEKTPWLVVKTVREPSYSRMPEKRFKRFSSISNQIPSIFRRNTPFPISLSYIEGNAVTVEKYLPGKPLWTIIERQNYLDSKRHLKETIKPVLDWLLRFSKITYKTSNKRILFKPIDKFLKFSVADENIAQVIKNSIAEYKEVKGIPTVSVHGDFSPQNILLNSENVNVLDWEFFFSEGLLFYDFFMLSITCGSIKFSHRYQEESLKYVNGMQYAFIESNPFSEMLRGFVLKYLDELNINQNLVANLLFLFLLDMTVRERYIFGKSISRDMIWEKVLQYYIRNTEIFEQAFSLK